MSSRPTIANNAASGDCISSRIRDSPRAPGTRTTCCACNRRADVSIGLVALAVGELLLQQPREHIRDCRAIGLGAYASQEGQPGNLGLRHPRLSEIAVFHVGVVCIPDGALHHHRQPDVGPRVSHGAKEPGRGHANHRQCRAVHGDGPVDDVGRRPKRRVQNASLRTATGWAPRVRLSDGPSSRPTCAVVPSTAKYSPDTSCTRPTSSGVGAAAGPSVTSMRTTDEDTERSATPCTAPLARSNNGYENAPCRCPPR